MYRLKWCLLLFLQLLNYRTVFADNYPVNTKIDVKHYQFDIAFSDKTDNIIVIETLRVLCKEATVQPIRLDLTSEYGGKGMTVDAVLYNNTAVNYTHVNNALLIQLPQAPPKNTIIELLIKYHGIPADGLHAGPTKFGDRSFFSDNWPNKARNWLATIDHPSDKATCAFIIKAPQHYKVVSNGLLKEESILNDSTTLTHWEQAVPIASWLFTLGVANFAMQNVDQYNGKDIQTWVYAKDRIAGFADFAEPSKKVLSFFSDYIGPYAYEKLANIESPIVSGGMEAASAIGYSDKLVTGTQSVRTRNVVIHEIAHQWFGNAITENNWDHAWLSEGFATFFTLLYIQQAYGEIEYKLELDKAKKMFDAFYKKDSLYNIVAPRTAEEAPVTNIVTYQKGAWILVMLKNLIGDAAFQKGIRSYYAKFMNKNASTQDFQVEMEKASTKKLDYFFNQWLKRPGKIQLSGQWIYDKNKKELTIQLTQPLDLSNPYIFPLEIKMALEGGVNKRYSIPINSASTILKYSLQKKPVKVELDPENKLLASINFN